MCLVVDAGKLQIVGAGKARAPWALPSTSMGSLHVVSPALQLTTYLLDQGSQCTSQKIVSGKAILPFSV